MDEPEDYELDVWAGVVPVTSQFGVAEPDAALRAGIDVPEHVRARVAADDSVPGPGPDFGSGPGDFGSGPGSGLGPGLAAGNAGGARP